MEYKEPLSTPVMKQYLQLKSQFPDSILFFRMGDFYEVFMDDALIAAPIMDVVLTNRQGSVPMAGVPYHSAEIYINRLLQAGKKVAIAEQSTDPKNPRLMQRSVVRIITPGTIIEENLLKNVESQYLMAISDKNLDRKTFGVALADISTGEFFCYELNDFDVSIDDLLEAYHPTEVILPTHLEKDFSEKGKKAKVFISVLESWKSTIDEGKRKFKSFYKTDFDSVLRDYEGSAVLGAISLILHYVEKNFPNQEISLDFPKFQKQNQFLYLDEKTIKNLNIFEPKDVALVSLFSPITPKGKRLIKDLFLHPLLDIAEIQKRLDLVEFFFLKDECREAIKEQLQKILDVERILTRMQYNKSQPRDFRSIVQTIQSIIELQKELQKYQVPYEIQISESLVELKDTLDQAIVENPPSQLGNSYFLKKGIDPEYDEAIQAKEKGANWVLEYERKERERTGLSSLKIGYNKVLGYFIEISKIQAKNAPKEYERKQTLVNYERFTCEELKDIERKILLADENIQEIEKKYYQEFINKVLDHKQELKDVIYHVGYLDVLVEFADVSKKNHWMRPQWNQNKELILKESRHPVVEKFLPKEKDFIPNDVYLNTTTHSLAIITGPNMAGKSTYIRQVALIQILAQLGCFVPAKEANLSIVDRIFTRVGASDNLAKGESTFLVEMLETSHILRNFTEDSLIIMDEIGRGTSTYDGMAIAWAIVEYLTERYKPKTMFATHYHELTSLEERDGVFNLTMDVLESDDQVIFLHKVKPGSADKSYGIHVAKLAGLPAKVIERAQALLEQFEDQKKNLKKNTHLYYQEATKKKRMIKNESQQIEIFDYQFHNNT
ncbi:MAG: DNA mismatch repair protein MutS [Leptospiraceae bacterium]|nr:DNA mismatch repair protein MutS [Leptospiraceae bacterium]MDW7975664.1 DNA mismatch repair protein MutS [Leptospiraceae bacterium]